jgi:hypothetical protein
MPTTDLHHTSGLDRGLQLWAPEGAATVEEVDIVLEMQWRDLLGRLIHKYKTAA